MKVRNIFFHTKKVKGTSGEIVYYTGQVFTNAQYIKNLDKLYDKSLDLYVTCNTCAAKKYKDFIKV